MDGYRLIGLLWKTFHSFQKRGEDIKNNDS